MQVGIVVISFNHFLFTKFCLESIINNTDRKLYKLCLVDNGSVDNTKSWAKALEDVGVIDKFISNVGNLGACKASNQGVSWCLTQEDLTHVLVMANDHVVTQDWLTALLKAPFDCVNPFVFHSVREIRNLYPPIGTLIDRYKPLRLQFLQNDDEEAMRHVLTSIYGEDINVFSNKFTETFRSHPFVKTSVILWPGLILYKREVIECVGMKDEEFLKFDLASYADIDYYVRVYKAGFTSGLTKASYVHHWGSITTRKLGLKQENKTGYKNNESGAYNYFIEKWGCNPHNLTPLLKAINHDK